MEFLRDRSLEVEQAGIRAVGISRDSPWSHVAWMQALDLNFALLSDWNADAAHGATRRPRCRTSTSCSRPPGLCSARLRPLLRRRPGGDVAGHQALRLAL